MSLLVPTFIDDDLPTARRAAREFLVQYVRWPHYAKTFAASGYADEMERVAKAYQAGDQATAMAALSDALLDDVVLLGPPRGSARASTVWPGRAWNGSRWGRRPSPPTRWCSRPSG